MVSEDVITRRYPEAQAEVMDRLSDIMDAVKKKDFERLESYHLWGPKFSKFSDGEPLERQDAETTKRLERELVNKAKAPAFHMVDPKVHIFGPVAVATFTLEYDVTTYDNDDLSRRARSTMVFVKDDAKWKIVHEHFSPFASNR